MITIFFIFQTTTRVFFHGKIEERRHPKSWRFQSKEVEAQFITDTKKGWLWVDLPSWTNPRTLGFGKKMTLPDGVIEEVETVAQCLTPDVNSKANRQWIALTLGKQF